MVRKDSQILGIDLHEQEIRVVQVGLRSGKPVIGKMGRAPMPEGAVLSGHIIHPGPVAVALRLLLNSMDIGQSGHAVVGVVGDSVSLRTLSVPPVPDSELPTIISGEVSHYGLVHSNGGTYTYLRLHPPTRSAPEAGGSDKRETWLDPEASDQNPSVVTVMAVEEEILYGLKESVEQANLTIDAIEPLQYGLYRAIMANAGPTPTLFALMVNPSSTDIAFVHQGLIVGYRRIDIGSKVLTLQYNTAGSGTTSPQQHVFGIEDRRAPAPEPGDELNKLAVHSLSLEVQRTLNYYQREFPAASVEDNVFIAIDDSRLEGLAKELTFELGVNVETIQPSVGEGAEIEANSLAPIYAGAFGLALHGAVLTRIPRLDLFTKQRAGVKKAETQRNFRGSIITSVAAVGLSIAGYVLYHGQTNAVELDINSINAHAAQIRNDTNVKVQARHKKEQQYTALRSEGVPVTELMDYVASSIKPGTGLDSVSITPDLGVIINGQSISETLMIITNQSLQKSPVLTDLRIINFHLLSPQEGSGVGFQISGKTVSINKVQPPPEEPVPGAPVTPTPGNPAKPGTTTPGITTPPPVKRPPAGITEIKS